MKKCVGIQINNNIKLNEEYNLYTTKYITKEMFEVIRKSVCEYYMNNFSISIYDNNKEILRFMNDNLITYKYFNDVSNNNTEISKLNIFNNKIYSIDYIYNFTTLCFNTKKLLNSFNEINNHYRNLFRLYDKNNYRFIISYMNEYIFKNNLNNNEENINKYVTEILISNAGTKFLVLRSYIREKKEILTINDKYYNNGYEYYGNRDNYYYRNELEYNADLYDYNNNDIVDRKLYSKKVKRINYKLKHKKYKIRNVK